MEQYEDRQLTQVQNFPDYSPQRPERTNFVPAPEVETFRHVPPQWNPNDQEMYCYKDYRKTVHWGFAILLAECGAILLYILCRLGGVS